MRSLSVAKANDHPGVRQPINLQERHGVVTDTTAASSQTACKSVKLEKLIISDSQASVDERLVQASEN